MTTLGEFWEGRQMPTLNEWVDSKKTTKPRKHHAPRTCADCGTPSRGYRCAQHAALARIGKPRWTKTGDPVKKREPSVRDLYPVPAPSLDTSPLTLAELGQAKCHDPDGDPDTCFPETNAIAEAKALCHDCPIQARCLTVAIVNREPHGIWGGATNNERERIRKRNPKLWEGNAA